MALAAACYSTGNGTAPPPQLFYYPVGVVVSAGGNVLYAVNSDFDLQYSGGTVQSYDLTAIRNDAVRLIVGEYTGAPGAGPLPVAPDAGPPDSGTDLGEDAGPVDSGFDAGLADGAFDTGALDAGADDGSFPDAQPDAPPADSAPDDAATIDSAAADSAAADSADDAPSDDASVSDAARARRRGALRTRRGAARLRRGGRRPPSTRLSRSRAGARTWRPLCPKTNSCPNNHGGIQNPIDPNSFYGVNGRLPLGQACAPPMASQGYFRDSVTIGAFATDAQLSKKGDRLFVPVRGDATLTWMDVIYDGDCYRPPTPRDTAATYPPFRLKCNSPDTDPTRGCDAEHHAGTLTDQGNTRQLTMPGEPFGMAFSDDGTTIALTHQTEGDTSLYLTGLLPGNTVPNSGTNFDPSIQFVLDNVPNGGIGIASVPHDPAAVPPDPANPVPTFIRPTFLETFDTAQGGRSPRVLLGRRLPRAHPRPPS